MKVTQAWNVTTGSNIRVAIIDDGIQLNHPDLVNNLLPGFDATGNGTNGGMASTADQHATSCAGIVAAQANNGIGVAGVAYSSKIVPIRCLVGDGQDDITTAGWMASAIDWASHYNRADVLSLSWHISQGQTAITNAVNRATTYGRNGYGCPIFAASGNNGNSSVNYPAYLPNVVAVGATENTDHRASFSQYGSGLDVVAPGVGVYTTDLQGVDGYNDSSGTTGDYTSFGGTSAATPNTAGVAALILSVNPQLSSQQVYDFIESNVDKTGGYVYTAGTGGNSNLTWNSEMGYGRVNAYRAVEYALRATYPTTCPSASGTYVAGSQYECGGTNLQQSFQFVPNGQYISICIDQTYDFTFTSYAADGSFVPVNN